MDEPAVTRDQMIETLEQIALLLELKGENPFKVRAYRTGADTVRTYPGDIVALARMGELKGIRGIGDALRDKLHELASTGSLAYFEKLKAEFPPTIFELFEVSGLGAKKIAALHSELGVASIADLKRACESGEAAKLPGFGAKSAAKILEALAFREQHASTFRVDQAAPEAERILDWLRGHPDTSRAEACGSYRRGREVVHDLDFLVATPRPEELMDHFTRMPGVASVIAKGPTKSSVRLESGIQCDLRAVSNAEYPFALAYFTGSREHNILMRGRALERGWTLNEYRLAKTDESAPDPPSGIVEEADLYRALGLDYIDPALREASGEIEAAMDGSLPRLVEVSNLRGTFHSHTTASDGTASLQEMAEAARELGLQYLGIADHSRSSFQANGLDESRLRAQIAEIRACNAESGPDFRLFAGSEVDILRDGSLDFPDEVLAELDYVVASVHNVFSLPEAEMTRRIIRAVENPHVTMLGHLTGRLLLRREGYAVDVPAVIEACAATGTIIELNANPWRLDMDWHWWRLAKEKGVRCAVNPDAHATSDLQFLWFGIRSARKGWLERRDVINCLPLDQIGDDLFRKRRAAGIFPQSP